MGIRKRNEVISVLGFFFWVNCYCLCIKSVSWSLKFPLLADQKLPALPGNGLPPREVADQLQWVQRENSSPRSEILFERYFLSVCLFINWNRSWLHCELRQVLDTNCHFLRVPELLNFKFELILHLEPPEWNNGQKGKRESGWRTWSRSQEAEPAFDRSGLKFLTTVYVMHMYMA